MGYFALVAALRVGNTGDVVALEPNPYTFNLLERNVSLNGFARVELIQAAAGERNGKAVFLNVLNPLFAKIQVQETNYPLGHVVYAKK